MVISWVLGGYLWLNCQTSAIIKSRHLNLFRLVLQLSSCNVLKPGVKWRMMLLKQHRQVMLQLHLSDHQFYCLLRWVLYHSFEGIAHMNQVYGPHVPQRITINQESSVCIARTTPHHNQARIKCMYCMYHNTSQSSTSQVCVLTPGSRLCTACTTPHHNQARIKCMYCMYHNTSQSSTSQVYVLTPGSSVCIARTTPHHNQARIKCMYCMYHNTSQSSTSRVYVLTHGSSVCTARTTPHHNQARIKCMYCIYHNTS